MAVELAPHGQVFWLIRLRCEDSTHLVGWLVVGVVVGSTPFWSEMMLFEVKQFSSDLEASEVEEVPNRLQLDLVESTVKTDERILKNIIGRLPSA